MPSRVIHIRLDDWVLLGCHDILQTSGKDVANIPLSTVVKVSLEALVRKMQQGEYIPTYDKEYLTRRLSELQIATTDPAIPFSLEELFENEPTTDDDMKELAQEAVRHIETEGEPRTIQKKVEISEKVEIPDPLQTTTNLFKVDSKSFSHFQKLVPKDRCIERAIETNDEAAKKAVAVCYTKLGKDLWGSD